MGGQRHAPAALLPGKEPSTHCVGGSVGPRAGLDGCGKTLPPGFDPRSDQPVTISKFIIEGKIERGLGRESLICIQKERGSIDMLSG